MASIVLYKVVAKREINNKLPAGANVEIIKSAFAAAPDINELNKAFEEKYGIHFGYAEIRPNFEIIKC